MKLVQEYIIVGAATADDLTKKVQQNLAKGYQPTGGLVSHPEKNGQIFMWQSMVKF